MAPPPLAVRGLSKAFGGTIALEDVDLDVEAGSIHALLGENGAGKSTLIKIVAGVHRSDRGSVIVGGFPLPPGGRPPGAAFIHQELGLVESLSVAENVALCHGYPSRRSLISWRGVREQAGADLARVGLRANLSAPVQDLSPAERSLVAIARALALRPSLVVLDEPTATLPEADVARLFSVLRRLREDGLAILYVSHRLDEVFRLCDQVTVLRDGHRVLACPLGSTTAESLVAAITGRRNQSAQRGAALTQPAPRSLVLRAHDLVAGGAGPVTFEVHEGEVLALVGLRGAGHERVARALFGGLKVQSGSLTLRGLPLRFRHVSEAVGNGFGLVPGNRYSEGMASGLNVRENLALNPSIAERPRKWVGSGGERRWAAAVVDRFRVRPRDTEATIERLSGGNQQKVILARWMEAGCRLLILEDPTSGVDVGARAEIYSLVNTQLQRGLAVVLVSSDFEEVAALASRALVMRHGQIDVELRRDQITVGSLTAAATGATLAATGGGLGTS